MMMHLWCKQFERDFEDMMQDILDLLAVSIGCPTRKPELASAIAEGQERILASKGPNPKVRTKGHGQRPPWRFPRRPKRRSEGWKGGVALQDQSYALQTVRRLNAQPDVTKHASQQTWCNLMETNIQICPR